MLKVKRVSYEFVDDQKIVQMLEKESQKGWNLAFMNSSCYFFKSSKQPYHYYVDFNYRSQEYDETLKQMGYEYVGNAYKMRIYRSVEQLEPLQSDPIVMGNALLEMFGFWRGITALMLGVVMDILVQSVGNFRFNPFNLLLHTDRLLLSASGFMCGLALFLYGIDILAKRQIIQKQMNGETTSYQLLHVLSTCKLIALILTLAGIVSYSVMYTSKGVFFIFLLALAIIVGNLVDYVHQKYAMSNQHKAIRFLSMLGLVLVFGMIHMSPFTNSEKQPKPFEISSFENMTISKEFDGPFAQVQYSDNNQHQEVAVIRHLKQPEKIVEGLKTRSLYWKEEMSHNTYYFLTSEKMAWIDGYGSKFHENQIDTSSYQKIESDKVDQMWHSGEFWILQKDDMVIFARCQESQVDGLLEIFVE